MSNRCSDLNVVIEGDTMSQEDLTIRDRYIKELWGQLSSLHLVTVNKTHTYLFTTNAGAAAGLLAYMGAKKGPFPMSLSIGLFVFFIGILLVGWLHERSYHKFSRLIKTLNANAKDFYSKLNDEAWLKLIEQHEKLSNEGNWIDGIAYASWACFFLGSASVLVTFLC